MNLNLNAQDLTLPRVCVRASACVPVRMCVRACVRACVCACVRVRVCAVYVRHGHGVCVKITASGSPGPCS